MELKDWLNRGYDIYKKLSVKRAHLDSLNSAISNYGIKEVNTDRTANNTEYVMIRYSELQSECDTLAGKLKKIDRETEAVISKLKNVSEYLVLYARYIQRLSWEDISHELHYSKQHTFKKHRDALDHLDRVTCYRDWEV